VSPESNYDVVVIGGGPAGYGAALYGAAAGLSVAVVERDKVGGTCLHRGCIPAKHFLETASVFRTVAGAGEFGVMAIAPEVDFAASQARKGRVVAQLHKGLIATMAGRGVTTIAGTATLAGPGLVRVQAQGEGDSGAAEALDLRGRSIILATGSTPRAIPGFEIDGRLVLSSDEVLSLDKLPATAAVIGGGAIGCEFASMMSDLGTKVTLLEVLPRLLPGCDVDVVDVVAKSFRRRGIAVHTGVAVHGHEPSSESTEVHFGDHESIEVDAVILAVGRRPLSATLGLDDGEVDARGFVVVDRHMRTGVEGVYAVGDLVDTPQLAHVAFAEAIVAIATILGEDPPGVDYANVPWCIYCHPEVAFCGMSEEAARKAGHDVVVSKHRYNGGRAMILNEAQGLVKVIAERQSNGEAGRILGVHMVGPWVTEQLGEGYLAVNWEATAAEVGHLIHPHPTLSETFGEAALALTGRGLHG